MPFEHAFHRVSVIYATTQAANVVGLSDQTDLFFTIQRALGLPD